MNKQDMENFVKLLYFTMLIDGDMDRREDQMFHAIKDIVEDSSDIDVNGLIRYMSSFTNGKQVKSEQDNIISSLGKLPRNERVFMAKKVLDMASADWEIHDNEFMVMNEIEKSWGIDFQKMMKDYSNLATGQFEES